MTYTHTQTVTDHSSSTSHVFLPSLSIPSIPRNLTFVSMCVILLLIGFNQGYACDHGVGAVGWSLVDSAVDTQLKAAISPFPDSVSTQ